MNDIVIPDALKPADGRFGSGPSKVRPEALAALAATGTSYLGTSHRQKTVKDVVRRVRDRAGRALLAAGGLRGRARQRRHHGVLGHRACSTWCASARSTWCSASSPRSSPAATDGRTVPRRPEHRQERARHPPAAAGRGRHRRLRVHPQRDLDRRRDAAARASRAPTTARSCWSTPRPAPAACRSTSTETDVYYFAPQKSFASDGGLWLALMSPAAIERVAEVHATGRWVPAFSDLQIAIDNSRLDQTYNTPALATLFLLAEQLDWFNAQGGLAWTTERTAESAARLYTWAEKSEYATPFVTDPAQRSAGRRHHRLRRQRRRDRRREDVAGQRHRRHRARTASSAATSCASRCSRRSSRTTSRR